MDTEKHKNWKNMHAGPAGGTFYGLGFVGALIYYFQHSLTFLDFVIGLLKAIVWPAFLIHKVFTLLGM
ncbi:MAG: hypothetical protein HYV90_03980 [Candidatus Woesebacteria bacterium]|nr:MAG: hypothetical protein HYV90_03980 [Candidatus Woesebacteria bacterium]